MTINDGAAQRLMVNSIDVLFSSLVTIQPGAFDLRRFGDKQVFQAAYAKRKRDAGYLWRLDANAKGRVWAEDPALFQLGYC